MTLSRAAWRVFGVIVVCTSGVLANNSHVLHISRSDREGPRVVESLEWSEEREERVLNGGRLKAFFQRGRRDNRRLRLGLVLSPRWGNVGSKWVHSGGWPLKGILHQSWEFREHCFISNAVSKESRLALSLRCSGCPDMTRVTFKATLISVILVSFDIRRSWEHLVMGVSQNYFISLPAIFTLTRLCLVSVGYEVLLCVGTPLSISLSFSLPPLQLYLSLYPCYPLMFHNGPMGFDLKRVYVFSAVNGRSK